MTALPRNPLPPMEPAWTSPEPVRRSRTAALFLTATPGRKRKKPVLSIDEERACIERFRASGDRADLWPLVLAQRGFVRSLAMRYAKWGVAIEDLEQSAIEAMLNVAPRFDPDRGARFITFAGWHARAAIQTLILSQRSDTRIRENTGRPMGLAAMSSRLLKSLAGVSD
jgi:DNA-directed RNA polymerase sigma subunit (sigma70/sigma32)